MKRLTPERREWLIRHQYYCEKRRKRNPHKRQKGTRTKSGRVIIKAPGNLCLKENFDEVIKFVYKLKQTIADNRRRFAVDFEPIRKLSPGAALILAAELDRWRRLHSAKLKPWKINTWEKDVRRLFHELGIFELLNIKKKDRKIKNSKGSLKFIKFITGNESQGELAGRLIEAISPIIGTEYSQRKLYTALSEAMTNVVQHAYPETLDFKKEYLKNQWWLTGSYNRKTKELKVIFYDQGVGIPNTLSSSGLIEKCLNYLKIKQLEHHDANMIKAALEVGKTRTKERYRGKGLQQLLDFIEHHDGEIRIISGNGEYQRLYSDGLYKENPEKRNITLDGTFIEWTVCF